MTLVSDLTDAHLLRFPAGFRWGVATAAYQIEGAATSGGRGPSIWDTYAATPGRVHEGHTGAVACDHYHRYASDVDLLATLGVGTYRFSVAWPRVQPDGSGPVNPRGLDFYDRLVDALLARGISPMATLYHWDLPQALEDRGGWTARETAYRFEAYASAVAARLADRVEWWTTLNEPWCAAFLGYAAGVHAPGRRDPRAAFEATHHLLLAHGLGAAALRAGGAREVSLTLNLTDVRPADPAHDLPAARLVDGLQNRLFLDPALRGAYPPDVLDLFARFGAAAVIRAEDLAVIAAPIDLLGVNYYQPAVVAVRVGAPANPVYPGSEGVAYPPQTGVPVTDMDWPVDPTGLSDLLVRLSVDYPEIPLIITENGAAYDDVLLDGDRVADAARTAYLDGHLRAAHDAIAKGADLRGYLAWSFLDNFEWGHGYDKRFGLVYVDYATQRRVPKDSALWFREVIRRNGVPAEAPG